eukprot:14457516-Ditylum_brightwellii.AAC.1
MFNTAKAVTHLLNYCATHPNAIIRYHASGMVLHIHSDALFMFEPQARSQAGGLAISVVPWGKQ